jgi:hypothetical protein
MTCEQDNEVTNRERSSVTMRLRASCACCDILFYFDQRPLYKARAIPVHMRWEDVVVFEAIQRRCCCLVDSVTKALGS